MAIETIPVLKEELPDLALKKETLDFVFRVCGYTPILAISEALASPNFGFFSDKYHVETCRD